MQLGQPENVVKATQVFLQCTFHPIMYPQSTTCLMKKIATLHLALDS